MKDAREIQLNHRARIERAATRLPAQFQKAGVPTFGKVDQIAELFCRFYKRDDLDNVRVLLRRIVNKAHAEARKERRRQIGAKVAEERFEEIRPRIEELERALKPARKLAERSDWEELRNALVMLPGIVDDMGLPEEKAAAQALLLSIAFQTRRIRIPRGKGRIHEIYPTVAIETLAREWMRTFPGSPLNKISGFTDAPHSVSTLFAAFAKAAWHDLAFKCSDLTKERVNSAIASIRANP